MNNTKAMTIRHTGIIVTDMDRALTFYRDLLGLKVVLDAQQDNEFASALTAYPGKRRIVMLEAPDGNKIELFQFYDHPRPAPEKVEMGTIGCSHVCFMVEDMDAVYEEFEAKGVQFNCEPLISPDGYGKVTYCHDWDGTIIELVEILDTGKDPYGD